jgi:hypothetical protein
MANVQITDLPAAGPITGSELVAVVQGGITVRATTAAVAGSPSQTQTFITVNQETTLPNSRYLGAGSGLTTTDAGAQGVLNVNLTGAPLSLVSSGVGFQVKTNSTTLAGRSITVSGNGISIANGNGVAGNPNISLSGQVLGLANLSANGILTLSTGGVLSSTQIAGTTNQIEVANPTGVLASPTISIADNAVFPGTAGVTLPVGTTAQQPAGSNGQVRYDSTAQAFYGFSAGSWRQFSQAGGITLINTGTGLTGGPITTTGTISIADTGVTAGVYGSATLIPRITVNAQGQLTSVTEFSVIGGVSSVTGTANEISASPTSGAVVLSLPSALTFTGKTVTGGAFNMTSATVGSDTVTTNTATQTLTNKSISGATNTLSSIANASLTNSAVTINGTSVSLGGSITVTATATSALTIGTGLTGTSYNGSAPVTIAIDSTVATLTGSQTLTNKSMSGASNTFTNIPNSALSNSTISGVALGSNLNSLTIGTGLTGTSYNGSGAVTVAIDSTVATLSGTQTLTNKSISGSTNTLTNIPNSALTNSSVTIGSTSISLGGTATTLAGLTSVAVTQDPVSALQLATKQYVDSIASGLNYHQPVNYATTAALASYVYNNGASGIGATITASANGALSLGGGSPTVGQRVLVKDEVGGNAAYNGIYDVTNTGSVSTKFVLTRSTDYDSSGSGTNEIDAGDYVLVISGTNASTAWVQQTPLPITVGTTALVFLQFNAPLTYSAGTGLNLSPSTTFNISNTGVTAAAYGSASSVGTFTVNAQGQLTLAATTAIAINGNQITSGTVGSAYISGSYTGITGVGTLTAGTWNASTIGVGYGGTGLASYTTGDLLYASGSTTLSKLALGTSGYVLTAGASAPQYVAQSTLAVGSATSATTATNLAGGAVGSVPYQSGAGTTLFLSGNTTTTPQFVTSTGTGSVAQAPTLTGSTGSGNVVLATSPTLVTPALGTPSSGVVTNLTGTASININGTVGATTANTGAFTTISATGVITSTLATGTAPFTVASTTQVANLNAATAGTATNATNTAITAVTTGATNYLTFVTATSGNLPQLVNSSITVNAVNGTITGGIAGGTF